MEVVVYTSPKDVDTLDHYITFRDWPSRTFHFDEVLHHILLSITKTVRHPLNKTILKPLGQRKVDNQLDPH